MILLTRHATSTAVLLSGIVLCTLCNAAPPDMILVNGHVFTGNQSKPWAEAIAVGGNRILAAGSSNEIIALAGPNTVRIEVEGRLVVPGFNDAHFHHYSLPPGTQLKLKFPEPTWAEVLTALPDAVQSTPTGTWIYGTVGSEVINDPEVSRRALDQIAPDHPLTLQSWFGHGQIYNSMALSTLGVAEDEPDPVGGQWEREPRSNRLTGKVNEYADWRAIRRLSDSCTDVQIIESLNKLYAEAARFGITSIQNMTMTPLNRYIRLLGQSGFPLRMRLIRFPTTSVNGRDQNDGVNLPKHPDGAPLVTVSGTKWILDGTPLERGMAVRHEYTDRPGWLGKMNFPDSEIVAMLNEAISREDQSLFHAVGDETLSTLLNTMVAFDPEYSHWRPRRVRIEHGDGLLSDLVPRASALGVVVIQNPTHFDPALSRVLDRFGPDMKYQPLRSLVDAGIPLALGSDGPMNPGLNLMFALNHPAQPSEAISLEQALTAYTYGSAFAEFAEQEKGTLEAGKLADLAVLSQDIFKVPPQQLPATESLLTLVDGKIVYDAAVLKRSTPDAPKP